MMKVQVAHPDEDDSVVASVLMVAGIVSGQKEGAK